MPGEIDPPLAGAVATGAVVAPVDGAVATGATVNATQISVAPPEYWNVPGYPPVEQAIPGEIEPPVAGAVATGAVVVNGTHVIVAEPDK
jgi:hypothetical protein